MLSLLLSIVLLSAVRISELAQRTGLTTPTLKYYIREGLLAEGQRLGNNRTEYRDDHVERARLVRALVDTGGLSIAATRDVLKTLDAGLPLAYTFEAAQHALAVGGGRAGTPSTGARTRVQQLVGSQHWLATTDNPGWDVVARVLDAVDGMGLTFSDGYLDAFARAARTMARADLAELQGRPTPESAAELMVVGTVLGDVLVAGLRRLAQQSETATAFPTQQEGAPS
jgi:DNA-binding transcriptional MerR regulator